MRINYIHIWLLGIRKEAARTFLAILACAALGNTRNCLSTFWNEPVRSIIVRESYRFVPMKKCIAATMPTATRQNHFLPHWRSTDDFGNPHFHWQWWTWNVASSQEPLMWVLRRMMHALEVTQAPLRLICLGSAAKRKSKSLEWLAAETSSLLVPKSMMHHSHLQGFISTIAFLWLPALRLQATSHLLHKTSQTHQLLSSSDPHPETPSDIVSDIPSGSIYIYAYVYIYIYNIHISGER